MYDLNEIKSYTQELKLLYIENSKNSKISSSTLLNDLFDEITLVNSLDDCFDIYKESFLNHQKQYDIILIDIESSDIDAIQTCKKIKEQDENQIIIIITSNTNSSVDIMNIGINKFILKPINNLNTIADAFIDSAKKILQLKKFQNQEFLLEQKNHMIDKYIYTTTSNLNGVILEISNAYLEFTGYAKDEIIGENHRIFRNHDIDKDVIKHLWKTIIENQIWTGELKNNKKSGEEYWIKTTICPLFDINNTKIGYTAVQEDITNQKRLKELSIKDPLTSLYNRRHFDSYLKIAYKKSAWKKEFFALILIEIDFMEHYKDKYGHIESDRIILKISHELTKYVDSKTYDIFRVTETEFAIIILDKNDTYIKNIASQLLISIENLKIKNSESENSDFFTLSIGGMNLNTKKYFTDYEDLYNIADENLTIAKREGRNRFIFDINDLHIQNLKNIDTITKLPNRGALLNDLFLLEDEAMLILLHINQVKPLKDLYGFVFVSNVISKKAKQLESILKSDETTLYNLNLQEFAILITNKNLFEKYLLLLKHSILANDEYDEPTNNKHNTTDFTAGVAYGVKNIFNHADLVLQEAIISKTNYKIYAKNQSAKQLQENNLNRLNIYKKALHSGNIIPYFQPIVDAITEKIIKYEALARIETESGEIISPYYFLDSAKEDKTFEYFTRQMMQKVFNVFSQSDVNISINITYDNIISQSMINYIKNRLDKYGGDGITFEIVESEDIQDYKILENFILMVKEYGCKISIDDFGSGYSNFTNILKLNIDYIKIDGSLITRLNTDENVKHMIKGILLYAQNTNIKTIAEFVSSKELANIVRELGINYIQGYYFGEPQSAKEYNLI